MRYRLLVTRLNVRNGVVHLKGSAPARLGNMNTVDQVVRFPVHANLAFGSIELHTALECRDNLALLDASGLVSRRGPHLNIKPNVIGKLTYGKRQFAAMPSPNTIQERFVSQVFKLRKVIEGDDESLVFLGRERRELAGLSEHGGNDRDPVDQAGCRKLPVESEMIIAHQQREYNLRTCRLDSTDGGSKIGLVKREKLSGHNLSTLPFDELPHPDGGDVT